MKKLVIVESPTKVRSIARYLGDDYEVMASRGHIRDLPTLQGIPAEDKKTGFGRFAVDVDNNFEPLYVVSPDKKQVVSELKKALQGASELLLATDGDREGEAIAWHLTQVLKPTVPVSRMVFNEITKDAIEEARRSPRPLNEALVDAQETRRILDRLYGYEVSPVLWRKIRSGLSAGRVQSPVIRLIVDREKARLAFHSAQYWDLLGQFVSEVKFSASLQSLNGNRIALGRDFGDLAQLKRPRVVLDQKQAESLVAGLEGVNSALVSSVDEKPYRRRPPAPFITSTLQQEAARKLNFSATRTMRVAQSLYENGYITYMRTDSPKLSSQALLAAQKQATQMYGQDSVSSSPRVYKGKNRNAQEAHEAIRPAGDSFCLPKDLADRLNRDELRLYELIWQRTVASQMTDAQGKTLTAILEAKVASGDQAESLLAFSAAGTAITIQGFLQAYREGDDDETPSSDARLPNLTPGQTVEIESIQARGRQTQPPARYTEASLVKTLEELGLGRPSTYASLLGTVVDRGYVRVHGKALVPTWLAFTVVKLMENYFHELIEYDFTAYLEDQLDKIAAGEEERVHWLKSFYFGNPEHKGLRSVIEESEEINAREVNSISLAPGVLLRVGRYGPYLQVSREGQQDPVRVAVPEVLAPDELDEKKIEELLASSVNKDRDLGRSPETGRRIVVKVGRFGPYVEEELEDAGEESTSKRSAKKPTPQRSSLFKDMDPSLIDLAAALRLLSLPRAVGKNPQNGEEIIASNGRFGPYIKCGQDTRSLESEYQLFEIDLEGAMRLLSAPKGRRSKSASVLVDFARPDPVSGGTVQIKNGRYGAYVTDGITNATIVGGFSPGQDMSFDTAVDLLGQKRAKGPAPARARRSPAKKSSAKRSTSVSKK